MDELENQTPNALTKEEYYELFQQWNIGSTQARERLITHNIRLVLYEVHHRFDNTEFDKEELTAVGMIGLIKAIDCFDIQKGFNLSTYIVKCIDNEIINYIKKNTKHNESYSIDYSLYGKNSKKSMKDTLKDETNLEDEFINREIYKIIRNMIDTLEPREKEIILLYFGFYNNKPYLQKEIAERFHVSQEIISRIIKSSLKKLEKKIIEEDLVEYNKNR